MAEPEQIELLRLPEDWEAHWKGMPEFVQNDEMAYKSLWVHFATKQDLQQFAELVGNPQVLTNRYIWFPVMEIEKTGHLRYMEPPAEGDDVEVLDGN